MNEQVIARLRENYDDLMRAIAWNILRNREDVEDAVQEAYLSLHEHRLRIFDPDSPAARAYVVQTIESRAINLYHKRKRQATLPLEEAAHQSAPLIETNTELAACLKKLKPEERQLLLLKYEHGYSVKEIAALIGTTPDAAYKMHQRAKKKLGRLCMNAGLLGVLLAAVLDILDIDFDFDNSIDVDELFLKK